VPPFAMTRHGRPIEEVSLKKAINTGLAKSQRLVEWDAAIAAGATLDELMKWEDGGYPPWFKALVMVWHERKILAENHAEEARADALK
jgi:hypothetical protein